MLQYISLSAGAGASGDTTKTKVGQILIPTNVKRIVGVQHNHIGGATLTSGENVTGLLELEGPTFSKQQIPFAQAAILTSGANAGDLIIRDKLDLPGNAGATIDVYVTMDMAQTGAIKSQVALVCEV